jgi:uncharacterized membrane protein required for colicin V production
MKSLSAISSLPMPTGGWFDMVVVVLLAVGFFRGRKHGMSQETLFLLQWLLIVVVGGQYYEPLSKLLYDQGIFGPLACNLLVYISIAIILKIIFTNLKRVVGEKIFASDVFGKYEFYLGMVAGMLRYACITIFIISLVNARLFTQQEIAELEKRQVKDLGSSFFPSLPATQESILNKSYTGGLVRAHLGQILLKPVSPSEGPKKSNVQGPAKRRESAIDEVISGGKSPGK